MLPIKFWGYIQGITWVISMGMQQSTLYRFYFGEWWLRWLWPKYTCCSYRSNARKEINLVSPPKLCQQFETNGTQQPRNWKSYPQFYYDRFKVWRYNLLMWIISLGFKEFWFASHNAILLFHISGDMVNVFYDSGTDDTPLTSSSSVRNFFTGFRISPE